MLSVIYAKCQQLDRYAECHYACCGYAECHKAECCGTDDGSRRDISLKKV